MLAAAIDVGSNTLRMLIGKIVNKELSCIYSGRAITRLAEGLRETYMLRESNMQESIAALKEFSLELKKYNAAKVKAVGTSAVREARNSNEFINRVFDETGIRVEPVSGIREAEFTIKGILLGFRDEVKAGPVLAVDIGGGSTEWIISDPDKTQKLFLCGTVHLGAVNLCERFMQSDPPARKDIKTINDEIGLLFTPLQKELTAYPDKALSLIGTGGTITALAALDLGLDEYDHAKVHRHDISLIRLSEIRDRLISLALEERRQLKGLEPERADLIIPGILLTIRLVEITGSNRIIVSDYGLLEGLIKEMTDEEGL